VVGASWYTRRGDADFAVAVKDLVMAGPAGEVELVNALSDVSIPRRLTIVAALGDAQGEAGFAALRRVLAESHTNTDTRCAALLALAKRDGVGASPELAGHLNHRSRSVRSYAMRGLAVVGDDRAWAVAMKVLRRLLDRSVPAHPPVHVPLLSLDPRT
jgi:HEAT repeat protein